MAKKKTKKPDHLVATGSYEGKLSRNKNYREDAWGYLKGAVPNYSNVATALSAILARDTATGKPNGRDKLGRLVKGKTQAQRAATYSISHFDTQQGKNNFKLGRIPYSNQAHHVMPCEVFYEKKWDAKHLDVVLDCPYDINNKKNIIYLPQCCGRTYLRDYHLLPDHSSGHTAYNKRVVQQASEIYDKVDEALDEEDCEKAKDLRDEIKKLIESIETSNFNKLVRSGASPMR